MLIASPCIQSIHDWAFTTLRELSNLMCSSQCVVSCHLPPNATNISCCLWWVELLYYGRLRKQINSILQRMMWNQHLLCIPSLFRVLTIEFARGACFTHGRLAVSSSTVAQPKDQMSASVSLNRPGVEEDGWETLRDEFGGYSTHSKVNRTSEPWMRLEDSAKTRNGILS